MTIRCSVNQLAVHDDGTGVAAVQCVSLLAAERVQHRSKLVEVRGASSRICNHNQVVQRTRLTNGASGVMVVDLTNVVVGGLTSDTVINQDRAE